MTTNYCTPDKVESWSGKTYRDETLVQTAIESACELIERETKDSFALEATTAKLFDGDGRALLLVHPTLNNLTKVETYDEVVESWTEIALIALVIRKTLLKYRKFPRDFPAHRGRRYWFYTWKPYFPVGTQNIRITGDWGWPAVPKSIEILAAKFASFFLEGKDVEGMVRSVKYDDYSVSFGGDKEPGKGFMTMVDTLDAYRLHSIEAGFPT